MPNNLGMNFEKSKRIVLAIETFVEGKLRAAHDSHWGQTTMHSVSELSACNTLDLQVRPLLPPVSVLRQQTRKTHTMKLERSSHRPLVLLKHFGCERHGVEPEKGRGKRMAALCVSNGVQGRTRTSSTRGKDNDALSTARECKRNQIIAARVKASKSEYGLQESQSARIEKQDAEGGRKWDRKGWEAYPLVIRVQRCMCVPAKRVRTPNPWFPSGHEGKKEMKKGSQAPRKILSGIRARTGMNFARAEASDR
ncbi:hypothetical protein K438DRAFT_1772673 [Mycena galopus ATCC 62051]|nr:hypothetical protein K438DRAFT_1772673 [Mycena galopus ATCC 62051]